MTGVCRFSRDHVVRCSERTVNQFMLETFREILLADDGRSISRNAANLNKLVQDQWRGGSEAAGEAACLMAPPPPPQSYFFCLLAWDAYHVVGTTCIDRQLQRICILRCLILGLILPNNRWMVMHFFMCIAVQSHRKIPKVQSFQFSSFLSEKNVHVL